MSDWHDATAMGSMYEEQTNGVAWRHRLKAPLGGLGAEVSAGYPWRPGAAPGIDRTPAAPLWRDASILNSPYEQQTDGERYRHRLAIGGDWIDGRAPDMPAEITIKDMEGCTLAHSAHLDGPRGKDAGCLVDGVEHKHFPPALAA